MLYQILAMPTQESIDRLRAQFREGPYPLEVQPVVVATTYVQISNEDLPVDFTATVAVTGIQYPATSGAVLATVESLELDALRVGITQTIGKILRDESYIVISESMPRRRRYVAFTNSLSEIWSKRPILMQTTSLEVVSC